MQSNAATIDQYLLEVPSERQVYFNQLRDVMLANIPAGFIEQIPFDLIAELMRKITVEEWIGLYQAQTKR